MPRRAFTLIELLVVIAIIAVLVAIILPAIGHARQAAQSAASLANLSSWGKVQVAYSLDFRDSLSIRLIPRTSARGPCRGMTSLRSDQSMGGRCMFTT